MSDETITPDTTEGVKHNHRVVFGRYVDGCPRCDEKRAAEPPAKAPGVYLTLEQLQELLASMQSNNTEALMEFARELKKPDPEVLAAKEAEARRKEEARARRIAEIRIEIEAREMAQKQCEAAGHTKENGKSAINNGQPHNDGFFHPRCYRCFREFPLIRATMETMNA